jgi:hypothetical protein
MPPILRSFDRHVARAWEACIVEFDMADMLAAGTRAAFGSAPDIHVHVEVDSRKAATALLSATTTDGGRSAQLKAPGTGLFDLWIPDLRVGVSLFEYDDPAYMELILRELALVAAAYLRGEGAVDHRRGLFGPTPMLRIVVGGREWVLERHRSKGHYPNDPDR